jgi:hypothetical protein
LAHSTFRQPLCLFLPKKGWSCDDAEIGTSAAKVVGKVGSIDAALDLIAKTEQSSIHTDR